MGKKSAPFNQARDIPALDGKVILVTGANIGLGKQCVLEYARHRPAQIWLAARNLDKARAAVDEIQKQLKLESTSRGKGQDPAAHAPIKVLELDLSSMESVKKAAAVFLAEADRLDILMLNAGVMAAPPGLTKDGYELQFGTNYLGHALLAKLLLPKLEHTANEIPDSDVRVIMLSSHGHVYAPKLEGVRLETLRTTAEDLGPYGRYGQSKLAQILWVRKMAALYPRFTLASIHPGVVRTNLMNNATGSSLPIRLLGRIANKVVTPIDQGVRNQLWASVSKDVKSGEYYEPIGITGSGSDFTKNDKLADTVADKIWDWTEKELEQYL
ncbi:retinol dehydrogenase 14 [Sodiomyces alkalinus F11]|uniref:Retinol dehydrogenase 14 n=1 Tax=Sodiomyces alkalinus (strain CBS 110278 / VKM F-3762 / F11) TaxID=1314773 RepID=A0A3N2Q2Z2_SODAK|nr:retinol dehydrogenase 14 [Sodiomyces alkalinus F11]ROT41096.1 retinol dehydrogenase 14 [Sodiomyces alkalinus F11]